MTSLIKHIEEVIENIPILGTFLILLNRIRQHITAENISFLAGGVAFYSLLSIFPAMTALVSLYGLMADISDVKTQLEFAKRFFPAEAYSILNTQLNEIATQSNHHLSIAMVFGLLITFFSAARGIKAMLAAMNLVYKVKESRKWLRRNALAYVFTVGAIATMAAAIFTIVAIPILINLLHLPDIIAAQVRYIRWLVLGGTIWFGLVLLFRYGPNRIPKRWFSMMVGAGVSTVLWLSLSIGFSAFVDFFPSLNNIYGPLSAIIILMFWFFLTAYAILIGAAVNTVLEDYFDI